MSPPRKRGPGAPIEPDDDLDNYPPLVISPRDEARAEAEAQASSQLGDSLFRRAFDKNARPQFSIQNTQLATRAQRILADALANPYSGDTRLTGRPHEFYLDHAHRTRTGLAALAKLRHISRTEQIAILKVAIAFIEHELGIEDAPELPDVAPTFWANRNPASKVTAIEFTRTIYGKWIGKGLTRPHLRMLDPALYHALSAREHRYPQDRIVELPTLAEVIDQKIAALAKDFTPEELRKLGSTLQSRVQRAKK